MYSRGWGNSWLGVALIVLGAVFFAQAYLGYELRNWWALFILIPATGALSSAYYLWRSGSTNAAFASLTTGLVIAAVAAIFLLGLPWSRVWPVLIIVVGVGMLLPGLVRRTPG